MSNSQRIMMTVGGYCRDLLKISAFINGKALASEANSILCDTLISQEQAILTRLDFIARQRGISRDELLAEITNRNDES